MASSKRFQRHLPYVALILICSACATTSSDPLSKYSPTQLEQMGEKLLAARDLGQALRFLTAAAAHRPNDPKIQFLLGLGYSERGLDNEALAHYQKALQLKPDYSEVHNALGSYYARKGLTDKAEESFKKALSNPFYETPHFALYNLGLVYENKGDTEAALQQYRLAIRLQPTYGLVYYRIGVILEKSKKPDQAREAYGLAMKYSPSFPDAFFRYGLMSLQAGDVDTGVHCLDRVIRLAPESSVALEAKRHRSRIQGEKKSAGEPHFPVFSPLPKMPGIGVMTERDLPIAESETPITPMPPKPHAGSPKGETYRTVAPLPEPPRSEPQKPAQPETKERMSEQHQPQKIDTHKASAPPPEPSKTVPQEPARLEAKQTQAIQPETQETESRKTSAPLPEPPKTVPQEPARPEAKEPGVKQPESGVSAQEGTQEKPAPEPQYQYIVQIGSFADKQTAESERIKLKERGYNAIVKPLKDKKQGLVYVVQLKPVGTAAKANTLMMQLEGNTQGEPVLIVLPAN